MSAYSIGISTGIGLVLNGVMGLVFNGNPSPLNQSRLTSDSGMRNQNSAFEGLKHTTSTQTSIPLIYGCHRIPGQLVDGKIKSISHDKDSNIKVKDYI
jgi:predicted phage tail protein